MDDTGSGRFGDHFATWMAPPLGRSRSEWRWHVAAALPRLWHAVRRALVPFVLVLAACGGSSKNTSVKALPPLTPVAANATTTAGEVIVAVTGNDFSFSLNRTTVPAGRVHVQLINQSKDYQHEVWMYPQSQPRLQELLAAKRAGQQIDEQGYLQGLAGHVEDVPPGQTAAFDVNLPPGTYELACFIVLTMGGQAMPRGNMMMAQGVHYDMGMHTLLSVRP